CAFSVAIAGTDTGFHDYVDCALSESTPAYEIFSAMCFQERAGASKRQRTPSGSKATAAAPPAWQASTRSMKRTPKPRCRGGFTGGPPVSFQVICRRCESGSKRQLRSTWPNGTDNAPYLAALVSNSWIAMATDTA